MLTLDPPKTRFIFNAALFDEQVARYVAASKREFLLLTRYYALFHVAFFVLGLIELFGLLLFFPFFTQSSLIAFTLATIFLTAFTYFVLRFYFQMRKPEQFLQVKEEFLKKCRASLPVDPLSKEYFLSLGRALLCFLQSLEGQELQYYPLPSYFETLSPLMEKFSLWCHWNDVHQMKELLSLHAIQEEINLIKAYPTDLEAHAALANAYIMLYKLYLDPQRIYSFIASKYSSPEMAQKFQKAASRALEELKIVTHYAQNDLWVHSQMAVVYHDLGLFEKEVGEYETLVKMVPKDKELLFRLGVLYFKEGKNGEALRIYEQLRQAKNPKAEELISHYGHLN